LHFSGCIVSIMVIKIMIFFFSQIQLLFFRVGQIPNALYLNAGLRSQKLTKKMKKLFNKIYTMLLLLFYIIQYIYNHAIVRRRRQNLTKPKAEFRWRHVQTNGDLRNIVYTYIRAQVISAKLVATTIVYFAIRRRFK